MARPASLNHSSWLPTYGWWPPPDRFALRVILTPFHVATELDEGAAFDCVLRGYAGSSEPSWERSIGRLRVGEDRAVGVDDLGVPPPPNPSGGVLEVDVTRIDADHSGGARFNTMWLDARAHEGGGYLIPTIPIRAHKKKTARDDLQVVPGVRVDREVDTELVILNPIDEMTMARLVVSSAEGVSSEGEPIEILPFSAWSGRLSDELPRSRRLLAATGGIGSLAVYSGHRVLPFFGFSKDGGPVTSMDHSAPIFA